MVNESQNNGSGGEESHFFEYLHGMPTPVIDPIARLVHLLVAEAFAAHCDQVHIDCRDDECTVHYLRGNELLPRDSMPSRLFRPVKSHIAGLCAVDGKVAEGSYSVAVSENQPDIQVVVAFAESSLRLRLMNQSGD